MSPVAWAVLTLIVAGCLYVLWLALQDPGREPFLETDDEWPGDIEPGEKPWRSAEPVSLPGDEGWVDEDLELTERIEAEAVAERVIDNLRHIRQDGGAA